MSTIHVQVYRDQCRPKYHIDKLCLMNLGLSPQFPRSDIDMVRSTVEAANWALEVTVEVEECRSESDARADNTSSESV